MLTACVVELAQREGEAAHPELGGVVEGCLSGGGLSGQRGDEDEVAAAPGDHALRSQLRHHDGGTEVDVERAVYLGDGVVS